jgi:regulator of sigma E protease
LVEAVQQPGELTLTVDRDGTAVDLVIPADRPEGSGMLGARYRQTSGLVHTDPLEQIIGHIVNTGRVLWSLVHPGSDINPTQLSGPVGIGRIFWQASEAGIRYVLWIAILVNVNLAIFNLLPIPVLDGGHMLFATIARLRGRALPFNFVAATQSIFMVLLFSMILYVTFFGDVPRWIRDNRANAQQREAIEQRRQESEKAKTADPATEAPKP